MTRRPAIRRRAALGTRLLVSCAFALVARNATAQAPSSAASQAYDQAVQGRTPAPPASFGHDVDLEGKAWDFVLTFADKAELPWDSVNKAKGALLNTIDLYASTKQGGLTAEELNRFAVKTLLDHLSPKEVVRVRRLLGLDKDTTRLVTKYGVGLVEGGAQAAGEAAEGDLQAVETALLTAVDTFCPQCAVARRGALLAYEAARAVEAWAEDEATRKQYETWKGDDLLLTTRGFGPTMSAARRALTALNEGKGRKPPTTEEVEQFVRSQFEAWKQAEADNEQDSHALEEVKDDYLSFSADERRAFGGTSEQDHASRFADSFLSIYQQMRAAQGDRPLPPGGQERLLEDAVRLARVRAADGDGLYRERMFETLGHYGWLPAVSAERRNAIKSRLAERLAHLSPANLKAFFDYAQLTGSDAFGGCLCSRLPGVGIGKRYVPGSTGPCQMSGLGAWAEPFPTDRKAWAACLAETKVGDKSFSDYVADRIIHWTAIR